MEAGGRRLRGPFPRRGLLAGDPGPPGLLGKHGGWHLHQRNVDQARARARGGGDAHRSVRFGHGGRDDASPEHRLGSASGRRDCRTRAAELPERGHELPLHPRPERRRRHGAVHAGGADAGREGSDRRHRPGLGRRHDRPPDPDPGAAHRESRRPSVHPGVHGGGVLLRSSRHRYATPGAGALHRGARLVPQRLRLRQPTRAPGHLSVVRYRRHRLPSRGGLARRPARPPPDRRDPDEGLHPVHGCSR